MYQIQNITTDPLQQQTVILPDGTQMVITLNFVPMQQGWFITLLTYGSFIIQGVRVVNSPNMLYQYRNVIPFGLACFSTDEREPSLQEDFSSQASILYILTAAEVQVYTEFLSG